MLAAQAAVAIENARLYESSIRWARQLESLGEVSKALANEYEPDAVLSMVCERIQELVHARFVYLAVPRQMSGGFIMLDLIWSTYRFWAAAFAIAAMAGVWVIVERTHA